jgi:hypothetical protein
MAQLIAQITSLTCLMSYPEQDNKFGVLPNDDLLLALNSALVICAKHQWSEQAVQPWSGFSVFLILVQ